MKRIFTLRTSEKDGFYLLIFAVAMCLVMSIFVYWSAVNLQDPHRPDYYYLPRLYFGIIFLAYWIVYMICEISLSSLRRIEKIFFNTLVIFVFPIAPLLYVGGHARNFEMFKKTQSENSDAFINILSAHFLMMLVLTLIGLQSFIPCMCDHGGFSVFNFLGFAVLWIIFLIVGLFELRRVNLSRSKKIISLIFVFSPMPVLIYFSLMAALYLFSRTFDDSPFLFVILIPTLVLTPFVFWLPLALYMRKYMGTPEKFRQYHIKCSKK